MSESDKLRLFVAFDLPRPLLDEIDVATAPLRERWPRARWVPIENQHVTIKFLAWVPVPGLEAVVSALQTAVTAHEPISLELGRYGVFPGPRRARVLWLGFVEASDRLGALAAAVDVAPKPIGFEREQRGFTPHLTLARFREPERVDPVALDEAEPPEGSLEVDRITLYRSHLSPKGPRYEALQGFRLGRFEEDNAP